VRQQGKLFNNDDEVIAEGACELRRSAPGEYEVTMWTPFERALMERQRGPMTLILEDGAALEIAEERRIKFRINGSGGTASFIYKLRAVEQQEPLESLSAEGRTSPTHL